MIPKNKLRLLAATGVLLLCASFRKSTSDTTCRIHLYKETAEGKWSDLKSIDLTRNSSPCIPLEYDSYYTLQLTDMQDIQALKSVEAVIGGTGTANRLSIDLSMALAESKDAEDYFTELPLAYVSCMQHIAGNQMIYTLLIKTKERKATGS
jgi:hypothetical protein